MTQTVGKVVLDYKFYSGSDAYSDGDIEDKLLDIVEHNDKESFNRIISEKKDWTIMYHLSHIRANIVRGLNISKEDTVLEIGSGCGAITGELSKKAKEVTCIELSKRRSLINANQNKECDNVHIYVGNFQAIEPHIDKKYDVITLIGVFEYANLYIQAEDSFHEFLNQIATHLAPGGRLIVAIENKFGLKYWAGCQEDHIGGYFSGLEGYWSNESGIRTFSQKELKKIFDKAGFVNQRYYYPYPDYKFPMAIYTDEFLPKPGELNNNLQNFDRERLTLFNESKVYDGLLENDMFPFFSNSYLVEVSKEETQKTFDESKSLFVKFSNERAPQFAIKTEICKDKNENQFVRKAPTCAESIWHVNNLLQWDERLSEIFSDTKLETCKCKKDAQGVRFEYIKGTSLESILDELFEKEDYKELFAYIKTYFEMCRGAATDEFVITDEFKKVFGDVQFSNEMKTFSVSNIDMVFGNIVLVDNVWKILDYEWCFDFPIPVDYVLYRALHYYVYGRDGHEKLVEKGIFKLLGTGADNISEFEQMEVMFQKYIEGKNVPVRELYQEMGMPIHDSIRLANEEPKRYIRKRVKIYVDAGVGFSEETAFGMLVTEKDGVCSVCIPMQSNIMNIRIDPAEESCYVLIKEIKGIMENGEQIVLNPQIIHNGKQLEDGRYVFATFDPWFFIPIDNHELKTINVSYVFELVEGNRKREIDMMFPQRVQLKEELRQLEIAKAQVEDERNLMREQNNNLQEQNNNLQDEKKNLESDYAILESQKLLMENSLSWKITKPLRVINSKLRNLLRK